MRDFAKSGIMAQMARLSLAVVPLLVGCTSPEYQAWQEENAKYASSGQTSGGDAATTGELPAASTGNAGAGASTTDSASTGDTTAAVDDSSGNDSAAGDTTAEPVDPSVGDAEKPEIVAVELPANVYAAGPVPLTVQTIHTGSVLVRLDGVDAGELIAAGEGQFTGELAVHGAIDNGPHEVEIIARQGKYEDSRITGYDVSTPAPGTEAWSMAGPDGSRTNRVALTPEGDLIEVGQTEIGGVPRPTIRKRSSLTGAELWPEKTITLDTREGAVVDVSVLPDGRMWVAMNVNEKGKSPQPRIALLDAEGHATGIEVLGTAGRVVRAISADSEGCFAVGLAVVQGDWDMAYWRITTDGVQTLGDAFDYDPNFKPHKFLDLANDVVLDGDTAWLIGLSKGKHDEDQDFVRTRGVLVPMDVHTGKVSPTVIVAPMTDTWTQSAFFGAARHPEGVAVTGYGCDETCSTYRIETSLYNFAGVRSWHQSEMPNKGLAYGSDVALDGQGRALVAGAVTKNGKLSGHVFGRRVKQDGGPILLQTWFPGMGPSEALGIVTDSFDRIFPAGYVTTDGATQARITMIHG